MRIQLAALSLALSLALGGVAAACGGGAGSVSADAGDRHWIRSDVVAYGVSTYASPTVFRVPLNGGAPEAIGGNHQKPATVIGIEPSGRYLLYRGDDRDDWWRLDLVTGGERPLSFPGHGFPVVAPDARHGAKITRDGQGFAMVVTDTATLRSRRLQLPDIERINFDSLIWSRDGTSLYFTSGPRDDSIYWIVEISTGRLRQVEGYTAGTAAARFMEDGTEVTAGCLGCHADDTAPAFTLRDGSTVSKDGDELIMEKPGQPRKVIYQAQNALPVEMPDGQFATLACGSERVYIVGIVDDRYLIYGRDDAYWIYGIEEDRSALLLDTIVSDFVWR